MSGIEQLNLSFEFELPEEIEVTQDERNEMVRLTTEYFIMLMNECVMQKSGWTRRPRVNRGDHETNINVN